MNQIEIILNVICSTLLDPLVLEQARRRKGAFSRNSGKLPFWTVMKLLLKNTKLSISASLDGFFTDLRLRMGLPITETPRCSQQAFSKARSGVDHTIFQTCFERVLDVLCRSDSHEYCHRLGGPWGRQVIAIDGSKIPLPNRRKLLEKYGSIGRGSSSPTAIASIAYDVLNNRILDAQFGPVAIDERTLAMRHMHSIKSKMRTNLLYTLFVFDRGYSSKNLIAYVEDEIKAQYLFRLRSKFNNRIDGLPGPQSPDGIADCTIDLDGRKTRVIKFFLPSGILETLITNNFDLDKKEFPALYFMRWPCEEEYKLIKEKVGLTNFRGYSENSVLQEFWISMLLANVAQAVKAETDGVIDAQYNCRNNKHKYQTNANELMGYLSRHIDEYMDAETHFEKLQFIRSIYDFAISHRVVDKKGRGETHPRQEPRKVKHHYNNKRTH